MASLMEVPHCKQLTDLPAVLTKWERSLRSLRSFAERTVWSDSVSVVCGDCCDSSAGGAVIGPKSEKAGRATVDCVVGVTATMSSAIFFVGVVVGDCNGGEGCVVGDVVLSVALAKLHCPGLVELP